MTNKTLSRETLLQALAEHLDDRFLQALFPGYEPASLRRLLIGAASDITTRSPAGAPHAPTSQNPSATQATCQLFTDGASRGNPGQAGAGAVLLNDQGEEIAALAAYLGICTNNVAEYKALIFGLEEALRQGCRQLSLALDSELIVRQIQGRYKVKNETLLPLFQDVRHLLAQFDHWAIRHVPRAENARADELANRGIDQSGKLE